MAVMRAGEEHTVPVAAPGTSPPGGRRAPFLATPFGRATFLRHLALLTATVVAYALRGECNVSASVLWVLGVAALANLATVRLSDLPDWAPAARRISPVLGILGWSALVLLTGGAGSPIVAGFWLEIVFSALVFVPAGTLLVTAGGVVALWVVQGLTAAKLAAGSPPERAFAQTGFLAAIGLLTFFASGRWHKEHQTLRAQSRELRRRLGGLERELGASQTIGRVGQRAAHLAHNLKNTVHSLRGFTELIEGPQDGGAVRNQALAGLRRAIDRLEETTRAMLAPSDSVVQPASGLDTTSDVSRTLEEVIAEVARTHPGVRWTRRVSERLAIPLSAALLRDVLEILTRNAAEASGGVGEIIVRAEVEAGALRLVVEDQGPGFDPRLRDSLSQPGVTTKPKGSGIGLFIVRRLVESCGGELIVDWTVPRGAVVAVRLPVLPN